MLAFLQSHWLILAAIGAALVAVPWGSVIAWLKPKGGSTAPPGISGDLDLLLGLLSRAKSRAGRQSALVGAAVETSPGSALAGATAAALGAAVESLVKELTTQ